MKGPASSQPSPCEFVQAPPKHARRGDASPAASEKVGSMDGHLDDGRSRPMPSCGRSVPRVPANHRGASHRGGARARAVASARRVVRAARAERGRGAAANRDASALECAFVTHRRPISPPLSSQERGTRLAAPHAEMRMAFYSTRGTGLRDRRLPSSLPERHRRVWCFAQPAGLLSRWGSKS